MIILFYPIIAAVALTALTAETSIARGRDVPPPCNPPVFSDVTVSPENVWAPAGKKVPIEVSGVVSTDPAPACKIAWMYFYVHTDNGIVASNITLGEGGSFKGTAMVNLFKDGKITEGKTYDGMISANDFSYNMSTLGFSVTVLHDRGKKVGLDQ